MTHLVVYCRKDVDLNDIEDLQREEGEIQIMHITSLAVKFQGRHLQEVRISLK